MIDFVKYFMVYDALISHLESPANEFPIDKVPFEDIHVENVQIKRISLNTVQLSICSNLGLSLIEVGLSPSLAIQLLYVVSRRVEQVAMIRLLVRCRESAEN